MLNFKTKITNIFLLTSLFSGLFFGLTVLASQTQGTIDASYHHAWGENIGWIDFGSAESDILVTDSELSGWAFGENIGWISLNCSNDDSCSSVDFKIANDDEGNLSGFAWGENVGWIDFSPVGAGVWIDSEGEFNGYAWGENIGWIVFGCSTTDTCSSVDYGVKTDWRPESGREQSEQESSQRDIDVHDVESFSTADSITIRWKTEHNSDSRVRYGKNKNLEHDKDKNENEKSHRLTIFDLEPETKYYFQISSEDGDGNSDSSKIYSIYTKPVSENLAGVPLAGPQMRPTDLESQYEQLKIEVGEKETEGSSRETLEQQKKLDEEIGASEETKKSETAEKKEKTNLFAAIFSPIGRFFSSIGNAIAGGAGHVKNSVLALQKNIQDKIANIGDKKEKAKESWRIYTARVVKKQDKKVISQVKFRLLDKKENPLIGVETTLFSDPKFAVTDEKGVVAFNDVPTGNHTLTFEHDGRDFEKQVAIAEPMAEQGIVSAEVVDIKTAERIAFWMWLVILALIVAVGVASYFAVKYYGLKKARTQTK
jgi:hypothetical protein